MTEEKLKINLQKLKNKIARKPSEYTSEYASTINESFEKYTRTRSLDLIVSLNEVLIEFKWPFPIFMQGNKRVQTKTIILLISMVAPVYIKEQIIFWKPREERDEKWIRLAIDKYMCRNFYWFKKEIFSSWKNNPIFHDRHYIIDNIHKTYSKGYWYSCMASTLPLLDFLCRKYLKTDNIGRYMTYIIPMFRKAGITPRDVMPGYVAWDVAKEKKEDIEDATEKDLRLVGIALSSFLHFAEIYYDDYRNDDVESPEIINRHAIIHGAGNQDIWTKENATKILIFLDLTLALEPIFEILLNEE